MKVLSSSGMRVSECASLRARNITFKTTNHSDHTIDKSKGKNGGVIGRPFLLQPKTLKELTDYCKSKGMIDYDCNILVDPDTRLFPSQWEKKKKKGDPVSTRNIRRIVKTAGEKALDKDLIPKLKGEKRSTHPHLFRHHFASHWYDKGLKIGPIANLMGNSAKVARNVYVHRTKFTVRPNTFNHPMYYFFPKSTTKDLMENQTKMMEMIEKKDA